MTKDSCGTLTSRHTVGDLRLGPAQSRIPPQLLVWLTRPTWSQDSPPEGTDLCTDNVGKLILKKIERVLKSLICVLGNIWSWPSLNSCLSYTSAYLFLALGVTSFILGIFRVSQYFMNLVQTFTSPSWWLVISLVIAWLFIQRHYQVNLSNSSTFLMTQK